MFPDRSSPVWPLLARLRTFVDEVVVPDEQRLSDLGDLDRLRSLMAEAKRRQLWALGHPPELGGRGLSVLEQAFVNEVVGRSEPAAAVLGLHTLPDIHRLHRFASPEQHARWIPGLLEGEAFMGLALTEPAVAGSDARIMRSTAHRDGDSWVLDGHKWFTTWADRADVFLVIANTDATAELDRRASAFLVPADTPGLRLVRTIPVMGDATSVYGELLLDGVRLPDVALLGDRGSGLEIVRSPNDLTAVLDAMRWVGAAERAFELMRERANSRWSHGAYLRDEGEIHRYVAESASAIHAARLMGFDAAAAIDDGRPILMRASLVQLAAARTLETVSDHAIQVYGAAGVSGDLPLERMYRRARLARLHPEPDEIHRMSVAREALRDLAMVPWSDEPGVAAPDLGEVPTSDPFPRAAAVPVRS